MGIVFTDKLTRDRNYIW